MTKKEKKTISLFNQPLGRGRALMREILIYKGLPRGKIDKICRLIPREFSLTKVWSSVILGKCDEKLVEVYKKYIEEIRLGIEIEKIILSYSMKKEKTKIKRSSSKNKIIC